MGFKTNSEKGWAIKNAVHWLILLILINFSSGCLYYGQPIHDPVTAPRDIDYPPTLNYLKEYFKYLRLTEDPEVLQTHKESSYTVQKLRFPTHKAYLYLPTKPVPAPGIVVLPISNGNYHAENMARFLASRGFACLRFKTRKEILGKSKGPEPLKAFENNFRSYIVDILQGIDWMSGHPKIDSERIGLVGISLGAIAGSIVTGLDPRVKASVLMLGGGDLNGILLSSNEKSVRRVRESLEKNKGLSIKEIKEVLNKQLYPFEPMIYAIRRDPSRILMINAYLDQVIRREHTLALWEAFGQPSMILVPAGHYSALLFLPYAKQKTLEHFQKLLVQ